MCTMKMSIISHYIISSYNIWIIKKEDCSFITSHVSMTKDMLVQNANVHALCEETWFQKSRICFRVPSNSIGKIWFQSVGLGEKWCSIPISFALIFFGQKKGGGDRKPIRFSSRLIFPSLRAGASENSPPKIKPFPSEERAGNGRRFQRHDSGSALKVIIASTTFRGCSHARRLVTF